MHRFFEELPEIFGPFGTNIRIPEYTSVPVTDKIVRLIDTREIQRLRHIKQLGYVGLVFPGAEHTRFEHSLGVYNRTCQLVKHLAESEGLLDVAKPKQIKKLILASLLHDIGHYHGAHVIEEISKTRDFAGKLQQFNHIEVGRRLLTARSSEAGEVLEEEFKIDRKELADFVFSKNSHGRIEGELYRLLDGPIDVDKMDYLERDSIHTGVPYGRNFDASRLVNNFTLMRDDHKRIKIVLRDKGKTGAELFIFSRYVMFTEVYWHHTARCFAAMFRRAFMDLVKMGIKVEDLIGERIFTKTGCRYFSDSECFQKIVSMAKAGGRKTTVARDMLSLIAGGRHGLYKRLLSLTGETEPGGRQYEAKLICQRLMEVYHEGLASWLKLCRTVARRVGQKSGLANLREHHILIDTPLLGDRGTTYPLYFPADGLIRNITEISPMAGALDRMFNEAARQIRVYCHPSFAGKLNPDQVYDALFECLD